MDFEYSKQLRNLLQLGLTEREAKVYLTLLTRRMLTALDIQEKVNIPRTKIYEVMQKLVNRGICIEKRIGRYKFYEDVEPETSFRIILEQYQNELKKKKEVARELIHACTPLFKTGKERTTPMDFIEILKDNNSIHRKYVNVVESTRNELLSFNKGPYACDNAKRLKEQQVAETRLMNRGGVHKNIFEDFEIENYPWLAEYLAEQRQAGQQVKLIKFLPIKMILSDAEKVMLALEDPSGQSEGLVMCAIEHKAFGTACKILFKHFWDQAKGLHDVTKNLQKQG
jgi:sugar-specific transcriptional regulator TrmB